MIQTYRREVRGEPNSYGQPVKSSRSIVDILTTSRKALVFREGASLLDWPIGICTSPPVQEGYGFGDIDNNNFYSIEPNTRKVYEGEFPFRHLDKATTGERYVIPAETTVDDILHEFIQAGYEVVARGVSQK